MSIKNLRRLRTLMLLFIIFSGIGIIYGYVTSNAIARGEAYQLLYQSFAVYVLLEASIANRLAKWAINEVSQQRMWNTMLMAGLKVIGGIDILDALENDADLEAVMEEAERIDEKAKTRMAEMQREGEP